MQQWKEYDIDDRLVSRNTSNLRFADVSPENEVSVAPGHLECTTIELAISKSVAMLYPPCEPPQSVQAQVLSLDSSGCAEGRQPFRLSASSGNSPDAHGEHWQFWCPLLEKAFAVHAGGWDKIDGGQSAIGLACLTGCLDTFYIYNRSKTLEPDNFKYRMCQYAYDQFKGNSWHDKVPPCINIPVY